MQTLTNIACGDDYTKAATLGPLINAKAISLSIAPDSLTPGATAIVQVAPAGYPQQDWGPEQFVAPQLGIPVANATGVRVRNAVTGQIVRVSGYIAGPADPYIGGGSQFAGSVSGGGTVIPPAGDNMLLGIGFTFTDVAITATTEALANQVVVCSTPIDFTPGLVDISCFFPAWFNNNTARTITFVVKYSTDGGATWVANGQLWRDTGAAATTDLRGATLTTPFGGITGSALIGVYAFASNNTNVTVRGGNYGIGGLVPIFLEIRRQS